MTDRGRPGGQPNTHANKLVQEDVVELEREREQHADRRAEGESRSDIDVGEPGQIEVSEEDEGGPQDLRNENEVDRLVHGVAVVGRVECELGG